jgi:hypothetical protein
MTLQPRARTGIALIAAYAVALQALLLAVVVPAASAAGTAALPICAGAGSHAAQSSHGPRGHGQAGYGQDCLDACLTGCCCGAPLLPLPPRAFNLTAKPLQILTAAVEGRASAPIRAAKAHRSRGPPAAA